MLVTAILLKKKDLCLDQAYVVRIYTPTSDCAACYHLDRKGSFVRPLHFYARLCSVR